MRKKLPLLLVAALALFIILLNMFSQVPQSPYLQPLSIDIPLSALQGMDTGGEYGLFLDIVLGGDGNLSNRRFCEATAGEIALVNANLANIEPHSIISYNSGLFNPNEHGHSYTYRMFISYYTSPGAVIPLDASGSLRITMQNMLVDHPQAEIGVRAVGLRGNAPMDFWVAPMAPIVSQPRQDNTTFSIESPLTFSNLLALRTISIHENTFGNFNDSNLNVRLEAPAFFRWATEGFHSTGRAELSTLGGSAFAATQFGQWAPIPPFPPSGNTPEFGIHTIRRIENVDGLDRDVLYIPIALTSRGSGAMAETIQIRNLFLLPEGRAGSGATDIHISTVTDLPSLGSSPSGSLGGRLTARPCNTDNTRRATTLNVGHRIDENESIGFTALNYVPTVRSGYLGMYSREVNDLRGVQTATVELHELVPGAWGAFTGAPIDFTFTQDGVTLIGATAQAGWDSDRTNIFDQRTMWINRTSHQWEEAYGNIRLSPTHVSITMPSAPESYFDQLYHLRALRVTFFISIEAGFETKNPEEDIYVTVSGAGINQLTEKTISVARPTDPISIHLPQGPVQLVTDDFRQIVNQQISDLEITIYEPHSLNHGSEIWVYVSSDASNHNLGININANQAVTASNPNLQLGSGRWVSLQTGIFGFGAIAFPITRVPSYHEAPEPITIRIEGIRVTGNVIPDVNYYVIVSGSAFAENDHTIFTNSLDIDPFGTFTSLPYSSLIHSSTSPHLNPSPENSGIVISQFDSIPGVDGEPIIFREIENTKVGFVSARAFAGFINNGSILSDTSTHTITGTGTTGNQVSVTMQSDSPTAIVHIDGNQHPVYDIAAWAGALSGVPYGQLTAVDFDGDLFLPFRAVANMFGYDVEMVDDFTVLFTPL